MREALIQMKPNHIEDIIALVALYRPGPMSNIPTYNDCKHGRQTPDYLHPLLEDILKPTYGVIIYQEQVMQIAQKLSGFTAGQADLLRRAMGKKKRAELEKLSLNLLNCIHAAVDVQCLSCDIRAALTGKKQYRLSYFVNCP